MARKLIVEIIGDSRSLERAFGRSSRSAEKFDRTMTGTVGRVDKGFGKLQRVAAGGFVGGIVASATISQLKSAIDVAAESQQVLGQTRVALESTGKSWDKYGKQIEGTVEAQSRLGFDDEALLQTFANFQRVTENVGKSLKLNNLAMDIARARNIDLETAANLVTKAALGQAGALRRVGIDAKTGSTNIELLRLLTEKYGGSAEAAADDARTANERLAVSLENVQEKIGTLLLPATTALAEELAEGADAAGELIGNLGKLADAEIPVLNIPINFKFPGTDSKIFDLIKKGLGETNPITGRTSPIGQVKTARDIAERIGDQSKVERDVRTVIRMREQEKVRAGGIHDRPIVVNVEIDGEAVGRATKKFDQRDKRRNPKQKRGPNASGGG